jgi:hypothetical protein
MKSKSYNHVKNFTSNVHSISKEIEKFKKIVKIFKTI